MVVRNIRWLLCMKRGYNKKYKKYSKDLSFHEWTVTEGVTKWKGIHKTQERSFLYRGERLNAAPTKYVSEVTDMEREVNMHACRFNESHAKWGIIIPALLRVHLLFDWRSLRSIRRKEGLKRKRTRNVRESNQNEEQPFSRRGDREKRTVTAVIEKRNEIFLSCTSSALHNKKQSVDHYEHNTVSDCIFLVCPVFFFFSHEETKEASKVRVSTQKVEWINAFFDIFQKEAVVQALSRIWHTQEVEYENKRNADGVTTLRMSLELLLSFSLSFSTSDTQGKYTAQCARFASAYFASLPQTCSCSHTSELCQRTCLDDTSYKTHIIPELETAITCLHRLLSFFSSFKKVWDCNVSLFTVTEHSVSECASPTTPLHLSQWIDSDSERKHVLWSCCTAPLISVKQHKMLMKIWVNLLIIRGRKWIHARLHLLLSISSRLCVFLHFLRTMLCLSMFWRQNITLLLLLQSLSIIHYSMKVCCHCCLHSERQWWVRTFQESHSSPSLTARFVCRDLRSEFLSFMIV